MVTVSIRDWSRSGGPAADLDRLFGPLYRQLMDDESITDLLESFCETLAEELPAVLVTVAKKLDGGTVAIEAAAPANGLWSELQSLPERWDGNVTGHGPAATALRAGEPAWISASEDGLRPWKEAVSKEHVGAAGAWPFHHGKEVWLLEIFTGDQAFFQNGASRRQMDRVVHGLRRFLEDCDRWAQHRLLAGAMEQCGHATFITDLNGEIQWTNRAFTDLYGYTAEEARGQTPALLRSGKQGLRYYRDLWGTIRSGKVWSGETVDRGKDGVDHTVRQTVTPFGSDGRITHYLSTHEDISDIATERERRELKAETDPETGLMNPAGFDATVDAAIHQGDPFALALLSLRGYDKAVAEMDPDLADAIAVELGSRLRQILGPGCSACVQGPGEYRLLLPEAEASEATLRPVVDALEEPFPMLGHPLEITPRAAWARFPGDGKTRDELIRHADAELADQPTARANRKLRY